MSVLPYLTMTLLSFVGVLLIMIVLLQRGRGGGLAGSLGGMGGQSAFGTKAGDVFTRITVILAIIWVLLAAANVFALRMSQTKVFKPGANAASVPTAPALGGDPAAGLNPGQPADPFAGLPAATMAAAGLPATTTSAEPVTEMSSAATPSTSVDAALPATTPEIQPAATPAEAAAPATTTP